MGVREERLENDYRALQRLCAFNEPVKIKILEKKGQPPEEYRIQLSNCKGVESVISDLPKYRTEHILVISKFSANYPDPGELPTVKMETPIFHPNIYSKSGEFCFRGNEFGKINEPLDTLVERIISMIQYENLKFGTPANKTAAEWADKHKHYLFPLSASLSSGQSKPKLNWR